MRYCDKTDRHCESVIADGYRILIDMSYCNDSNEFTNKFGLSFSVL